MTLIIISRPKDLYLNRPRYSLSYIYFELVPIVCYLDGSII